MRKSSFGFWPVILVFAFVLLVSGCARVTEGAKCVAGVSTQALEDKRKEAIVKTFNCDYDTCYNKTKKILSNSGNYIYAESMKKQMIAIYLSFEDTTAIGVFFKIIDANNTQVEVSSASTYAKEYIAGKLFPAIEKALRPEEEKGQTDAKEDVGSK
ncbi:MAG: hypothetical protein M0R66_10145 [Candidatus Omnitrophica bacterium]|nr:hypothetical protein [Candidatus Omnitrophota bacterium]